MSKTEQIVAESPTQDERTFAVLAHALQVVGWWIAPLIIFLVKLQSRFVSFHALQALLFQVLFAICWVGLMAAFFAVAMISVFQQQPTHSNAPPLGIFIIMPLVWLVGMGGWVAVILLSILYSIKAGRGEWAEYPLLGKRARKILKIHPGGTSVLTG